MTIKLCIKLLLRRFFLLDSFCKKCGRKNRDFVVSNEIWTKLPLKYRHVLCYDCFCDVCDEIGISSLYKLNPSIPRQITNGYISIFNNGPQNIE